MGFVSSPTTLLSQPKSWLLTYLVYCSEPILTLPPAFPITTSISLFTSQGIVSGRSGKNPVQPQQSTPSDISFPKGALSLVKQELPH